MEVKHVGFGGTRMDYPVYEAKNGGLFFDMNKGKDCLVLYSGAYRENDKFFGEPDGIWIGELICDNPFIRQPASSV